MSAGMRNFTILSCGENEDGRLALANRGEARENADQMRRLNPGGDANGGAGSNAVLVCVAVRMNAMKAALWTAAMVKVTGATEARHVG